MYALLAISTVLASQGLSAFSPVPTTLRDLEDRLIVRFEAGWEPIFASFSGQPDLQANLWNEDLLRADSMFVASNLAFGTRGVGWSTFNTYLLSSARFELQDSTLPAASPDVVHRFEDSGRIWFHLIYGELSGLSDSGVLANLFLRAGRQFHFGLTATTFDGATLGYRDDTWELMLRGGRRSALFDRTQNDPGSMFGGEARFSPGPLSVAAEVIHFRRELLLLLRDRAFGEHIDVETTLGELRGSYELAPELGMWARLSLVSPELSHIRAGADWAPGPLVLSLHLDQKIGRDLYYDLAGGTGGAADGRSSTYETLRLNIPDRAPYSHVELAALISLTDWLELDLTPGARIVYGRAAERSPFDATHVFGTAGLRGRFVLDEGSGLEADATYTALVYWRGGEETGTFRDEDMGGETSSHELTAGLRFTYGGRFVRRRLLGSQIFSAGVLGYLRTARLESRLIEPIYDSVFGGVAELGWSFTEWTRLELAYEYARDSRIFVPHLSDFHRVRTSLEARF